jgi:hypothetical protein
LSGLSLLDPYVIGIKTRDNCCTRYQGNHGCGKKIYISAEIQEKEIAQIGETAYKAAMKIA